MAELCAVVGIGQTKHAKVRDDLSLAGLLREAAIRALEDAQMTWADVEAVVIGTAPDMFEGVMMPEIYLADALGCAGKPMMRVHTAGSVGGSTAVVASHLIQSGIHQRVLTVAFEKQSEGDTSWGLSGGRSGGVSAGGYFAPHMRSYIERSGAPDYVGWQVAVKDRLNALKNPYAHLQMPDITLEMVRDSPMVWEPIRRFESCPTSDGACAMVLTDEAGGDAAANPPAWVHATAIRSELGQFPGRDPVNPKGGQDCAADVYRQAGITDPFNQVDVVECYVPFSWYEPMWMENLGFAAEGDGWKLTEKGVTEMGGELPVNPSGGVLSSNPIGASGMLRFAEAALQVRGQAGEHQIDGARTAVGHAYGGAAQFFAMWVVRSDNVTGHSSQTTEAPHLLVERDGPVMVLTMNRPERRNALSADMMQRMSDAWDEINANPGIRVAILTGAGGCFCAGADLEAMTQMHPGDAFERQGDETISDIARGIIKPLLKGFLLDKPLIAAVEGPAVAGGTEILQATDVRIAGESARFGVSEVRWGLYPLGGSVVRLRRQIPYALAADILLTGRHLLAPEAKEIGLIGEVVPDGQALDRAREVADKIASNGPVAVQAVLRALRATESVSEQEAMAIDSQIGMDVFKSEDAKEGPVAFMEKRTPQFKGR